MNKVDKIPHIEDLLFTEKAKDVGWILSRIECLIKTNAINCDLTIKYDGCPSIIAGNDPEDGKFFVATKGLFNKTPVLFKSLEELQYVKKDGLRKVLVDAFVAFSKLEFLDIWQGDLMWSGGLHGDTFQNNTLRYKIPPFELKEVSLYDVGIAWHTSYRGKSIRELCISDSKNKPNGPGVFSINTIPDMRKADIRKFKEFDKKDVLDFETVVKIKHNFLDILESTAHYKAFLPDGKQTNQEGFVFKMGKTIVKLVNRNVFTIANKASIYEKN